MSIIPMSDREQAMSKSIGGYHLTDREKALLPPERPHLEPRTPRGDDALLRAVASFVKRFVAFTAPEQVTAVVLWIVHCHAFGAAETTARLAVQSAEKQSGKTRLLEVLELLVLEPLSLANVSPAYMFRRISDGPATLLIDEVDAIFNPKANGNMEEIRGLLNAGYRKGATVGRIVGEGKGMKAAQFPVFAPVALAGIGALPDTLQDRSIVIRLKRRARGEPVDKLRRRLVTPEANLLREKIAAWTSALADTLTAALPDVPDMLPDRACDIWEPLFAIADEAGGKWPERARAAALKLSTYDSTASESERQRLLADVRTAFDESGQARLSSADLVAALHKMEESPWSESWFDQRKLAAKLRPYDVRPKQFKVGKEKTRGYERDDLEDAFDRYLCSTGTTGTTGTSQASPSAESTGVPVVPVISGVGSETVDTTDFESKFPDLFDVSGERERARQRAAEGME